MSKTTSESVRDAFKYMYPDELPALKKLAQSLPKDPVIINIGAGSGTSGLAFLECRDDSIVHTIDITDGDSPFGCLYAERDVVTRAELSHLKGDRWYQHHGDSKEVGRKWLSKVDMVFVDGDHSYDGCRGDIEIWLKHLKPGGLIVVHDYGKGELADHPDGPHPKAFADTIDKAVHDVLTGKYKQHSRVDSMIVFINERIDEKPASKDEKPASKPVGKQRKSRVAKRPVGRQRTAKVSD